MTEYPPTAIRTATSTPCTTTRYYTLLPAVYETVSVWRINGITSRSCEEFFHAGVSLREGPFYSTQYGQDGQYWTKFCSENLMWLFRPTEYGLDTHV